MKVIRIIFIGLFLFLNSNFLNAEEDIEALMKKGYGYVQRGNLRKALEIYKKALKTNPFNVDIYYNLGEVSYGLKLCGEAILYYSAFLYITPDTSENKKIEGRITHCEKVLKNGGWLSVNTTPEGMEIWINGIIIGETPLKKLRLDRGNWTVEVKHPDYEEIKENIEIKEGEEKSIVFTPKMKLTYGFLEVKTQPAEGVKVYLDEEFIGITPMEGKKLESKKYLIRFEKEGYDKWVRYITIEKDKTYKIEAPLEKLQPLEKQKKPLNVLE